ncbi:hypothetical protein GOODEAATRI_014228 [Goodea atripinnis]|uniref:Secreted protein n=1 Tax=Goodea atripinnis TaxID=208336 RepID=A0ABV0MHV7_9TELE
MGAWTGSVCVSVPLCFFFSRFSWRVELCAASHICESLGSLWQLLKERVAEHSTRAFLDSSGGSCATCSHSPSEVPRLDRRLTITGF